MYMLCILVFDSWDEEGIIALAEIAMRVGE